MNSILKAWLPPLFTVTMIFGVLYVSVQQVYRQNANDPQIALAEDTAAILATGSFSPSLYPTQSEVDIAKSLSPFMVIYDDTGVPLLGSGKLHDTLPTLPSGVFTYTKNNGEDRITWQPEQGLRYAIVVVHFTGVQSGFVMVGRSLREVEYRINNFTSMICLGWTVTLLGSLMLITLSKRHT